MSIRKLGLGGLATVLWVVVMGVLALPALAAPEAPVTHAAVPSGTSAVLHGELNPGRGVTEKVAYYFAYSPGEGSCTESGKTAPAVEPYPEAEGHRRAVSLTASGLEPNQVYQVCLVAEDPVVPPELAAGNQLPFRTLVVAPEVVSGSEQTAKVTPFSATFEAKINPENNAVACTVEYGPTAGYGSKVGCGNFGGFSEQPVAVGVSGLTPGSEYHFRVLLENEATHAKEYGADATFKTLTEAEAKPVVESETVEPADITPAGATVEAKVDPDYLETSCTVEYSTVKAKVEAGTAEGVQACSVPAEGSGTATSVALTGLESSKTYYYRLVVTDTVPPHATGDGAVGQFTTLAAAKPQVEEQKTSSVTPAGATLEAVVNPEYQKTECEFEYGKASGSIGEHKATCSPATLEGSGGQPVSTAVTGLTAGTKYQFRVLVKNATGTEPGAKAEFETATAEKPVVESLDASSVTPFEEALEAKIDPDFQATSCKFQYGTTAVSEHEAACEPATLENGPEQTASLHIAGLAGETPYKYRVVVKNAAGEETKEATFTTGPPAPFVESESYSQLAQTSVLLEAQIDPELQPTVYGFEYANSELELLEGHGTFVAGQGVLNGDASEHVTVTVSGLSPNTQYFYRATATNPAGTETGPGSPPFQVQTFTTTSDPLATTGAASAITTTTATIAGTVNPEGRATTYYFQYGGTTNYGQQTLALPAGEGTGATPETAALEGLQPGVIYHYRIVATNTSKEGATQTALGEDETFTATATTPVPPPVVAPAAVVEGPAPPAPPVLSAPATPAFVPYQSIAELNAQEAKEDKKLPNPTTTKTLTKAEKLKKALQACHKKHGGKRASCEKQAHRKYPATNKQRKG